MPQLKISAAIAQMSDDDLRTHYDGITTRELQFILYHMDNPGDPAWPSWEDVPKQVKRVRPILAAIIAGRA